MHIWLVQLRSKDNAITEPSAVNKSKSDNGEYKSTEAHEKSIHRAQ